MRPDTVQQLGLLFAALSELLQTEAHYQEEREAHENRRQIIDRAAGLAHRLEMRHGLSRPAAAESAAVEYSLPRSTVMDALQAMDKAEIRSRLAAAEVKRKKGDGIRAIARTLNLPKSTVSDRFQKRA